MGLLTVRELKYTSELLSPVFWKLIFPVRVVKVLDGTLADTPPPIVTGKH